jgi:hypothetical protein
VKLPGDGPTLAEDEGNLFFQVVEGVAIHGPLASIGKIRQSAPRSQATMAAFWLTTRRHLLADTRVNNPEKAAEWRAVTILIINQGYIRGRAVRVPFPMWSPWSPGGVQTPKMPSLASTRVQSVLLCPTTDIVLPEAHNGHKGRSLCSMV